MSSRRRFPFAFLVLVLGASSWTAPASAADIEKYLPDDSQFVVTVNVRQILDSGIVKKHAQKELEETIKSKDKAQEIFSVLGFDPLKDVDSVTLASPGQAKDSQFTVIVRGRFDLDKIHKAAGDFAQTHQDSLKVHEHGKTRMYEGTDPKKWTPTFASFLDKETLVSSNSRGYVEDAIDKNSGKKEAKVGKDLQGLVGSIGKGQSAWLAVAVTKEMKEQIGSNPQTAFLLGNPKAKNFLDKLESFNGGFSIADDFKLNFHVQVSDPTTAKELRQMLEAGKGLAVIAVNTNEKLKEHAADITDILNAAKFTLKGGLVGLEITIPSDAIEKNVKNLPSPK